MTETASPDDLLTRVGLRRRAPGGHADAVRAAARERAARAAALRPGGGRHQRADPAGPRSGSHGGGHHPARAVDLGGPTVLARAGPAVRPGVHCAGIGGTEALGPVHAVPGPAVSLVARRALVQ